jgi:hypothetical protein
VTRLLALQHPLSVDMDPVLHEWTVPQRGRVEGEEEVVVAAGRLRAIKRVLRGQVARRLAAP